MKRGVTIAVATVTASVMTTGIAGADAGAPQARRPVLGL
jgi:hypothetical protein